MENISFYPNHRQDINGALAVLKIKKVALFIVAYNAENHIHQTLRRIPKAIVDKFAGVYLIDDYSQDQTLQESIKAAQVLGLSNFRAMRTPFNQGYGGNQKIGYQYAIDNEFDYVIMLHADGQYAPEFLPDIIKCLEDDGIAAVFGSRMINRYQALKGGMPLYKWVGNQLLTAMGNKILGSNLSEFHSGYRAYSTKALKSIPFAKNSNSFHFDTDIIIQLLASNFKIKEIAIPTYYGKETSSVNGFKYFLNFLKSIIHYKFHRIGILHKDKFSIEKSEVNLYNLKKNPNTLHSYILNLPWQKTDRVVDLGANDGRLTSLIGLKVKNIIAVDVNQPTPLPKVKFIKSDLNGQFDQVFKGDKFDKVVALDVIEHLNDPEQAIQRINSLLQVDGKLYISTANVAFIVMRIMLMLGWFNYGRKGILDRTHRRLFTIGALKRLLKDGDFVVEKIIGFGPPIADEISNKGVWGLIDRLAGVLAKVRPPFFGFNFLIIAKKKLDFRETYKATRLV